MATGTIGDSGDEKTMTTSFWGNFRNISIPTRDPHRHPVATLHRVSEEVCQTLTAHGRLNRASKNGVNFYTCSWSSNCYFSHPHKQKQLNQRQTVTAFFVFIKLLKMCVSTSAVIPGVVRFDQPVITFHTPKETQSHIVSNHQLRCVTCCFQHLGGVWLPNGLP